MQLINVWLEHPIFNLNRTFTYFLNDEISVQRGMRVRVPLNAQHVIGFIDSVEETQLSVNELSEKLGYEVRESEKVIDEKPVLNDELYELGLWMAHETVTPVISCFQSMLPKAMKPRSNAGSSVLQHYVRVTDASAAATEKQKAVIDYVGDREILRSEANKMFPSTVSTLIKKGALEVISREKQAEVGDLLIREADYPLTDEQKQAIRVIKESNNDVVLLHGLTGTGKTEIYMQLAADMCRHGKQVLILVPEITLTPQMVTRMQDRFGRNIAIYHSRLNDQQRYEQYQLVADHKVSIVVGTRSAVFMPFDNLGLIVMDEEHDHSYKQDSSPRYHCRDVAIRRGRHHGCKVILGSATPSLESYSRAIKGVYQLVELKHRIYTDMPHSHVVDMQAETRKGNFILSSQLEKAIKERLDKKEQIILLLNRRGYTTVMKCRSCGHVVQCPNCDVALSYHKDTGKLMCHTCGYETSSDMDCPECGKHNWNHYGLGTQRLYETIHEKFPQARILRMDADTTTKKNSHREILDRFGAGEADILLGTQMISKGLDYPGVTLVGIFNADALLGRTDYRSVEVTFDLIVQASGRSGRGQNAGEVYVQAYDCRHYGIRLAVKQDYLSFFNEEMRYRHLLTYPPYSYMAAISFISHDDETASARSWQAADHFRTVETIKTLGPSQLGRQMSEYRYRIVLKSRDREELIGEVWKWFEQQTFNKKQIRVSIDIDPFVLD